jgi:hypothetical protein
MPRFSKSTMLDRQQVVIDGNVNEFGLDAAEGSWQVGDTRPYSTSDPVQRAIAYGAMELARGLIEELGEE